YSNTFDDERFGVSANFSYHRRDFQRQAANVRSWLVNPNLSVDAANIIDNRPMDAEGNPAKQFFDPNAGENGEFVSAAFFPQEVSFAKD
ncbi:hypothetical protein, partial [Pseudomonas sp. SIMBA_021]